MGRLFHQTPEQRMRRSQDGGGLRCGDWSHEWLMCGSFALRENSQNLHLGLRVLLFTQKVFIGHFVLITVLWVHKLKKKKKSQCVCARSSGQRGGSWGRVVPGTEPALGTHSRVTVQGCRPHSASPAECVRYVRNGTGTSRFVSISGYWQG